MIKKFKEFFTAHEINATTLDQPDEIQKAVCAVLIEAAYRDGHFDPVEHQAILKVLQDKFGLSADAAASLFHEGKEAADESLELYTFTRTIGKDFSVEQRQKLIESLWAVVLADNHVDAEEEAMIRKVASLLYLTDREMVAAKRAAMAHSS